MKKVTLTTKQNEDLTANLAHIKELAKTVHKDCGISITIIAKNGNRALIMTDPDTMDVLNKCEALKHD